MQLTLFCLIWITGLYVFNSLVAREFKKISLKPVFLYISTLAMLGVYGETIFGNVYNYLLGHLLWQYTIFPIHHGYTSRFALVLWGMYGFHLYLMHDSLGKRNIKSAKHLSLIFCVEAIIIEALVNLTYRATFGKYIFYYFPADLWHLTSIEVLPVYVVGGFAINEALKRTKPEPIFFGLAATMLAFVLIFLT